MQVFNVCHTNLSSLVFNLAPMLAVTLYMFVYIANFSVKDVLHFTNLDPIEFSTCVKPLVKISMLSSFLSVALGRVKMSGWADGGGVGRGRRGGGLD